MQRLRGRGAVVTYCEEAFEVDFDEFDKIDKSLRGQLPEGYYFQWLITLNPTSSSSWIKPFFFDTPRDSVLAMTTTYKCNEWLDDDFIELMEFTKKTDPERYKVDGLGEWGVSGGQYFSMWRESLHVVKPFKIPREWMKFRAMDFGTRRPYAVLWFAVDYDGDLYAYRELYGWGGKPNVGTGETARQIGEKITELEKADEALHYGVLDSACWARTGVTGPTIAEEINRVLADKGLVPFIPSSKGRLEGANAFKQRLIGNADDDGNYKPAIKFFSTCIHTLRTIPMIGHDKHKPELPDTDAEDHCFVAGTLISTMRGEIPIENVSVGDKVLTRKGFKKVLAAGMTKRGAKVVTVTFSDGNTLTGTGNHPIFIKGKGFIALDAVKYSDIIYSKEEAKKQCLGNKPLQQIRSCSMALHSGVTLIPQNRQNVNIIEQTGVCVNKAFAICTERYGSFITAKFLKDTTCTTRTAILLTMTFLILNCSKGTNIYCNMRKQKPLPKVIWKMLDTAWTLQGRVLRNGTALTRGANGTENTGKKLRNVKRKSQKSNAFVSNVVKNSILQAIEETVVSIAPLRVVQNTGVTMGLTMKPESAQSAAKNSESTVSAKPKPVVKSAEVSVVGIREESEKADVYNLTVDEEHEYFANGFLVHNCYDAIAYACLSRPWVPIKKADTTRRRDRWRKEKAERSAWTY